MVEYALLLANSSFHSFAVNAAVWASSLNWHALWYGGLAFVVLRIAVWAFRPSDHG